jgi:hypothetical protein
VPGVVIRTTSALVGTWCGFQLVAALQLPPLVLVQVIVAASAKRSASATQLIADTRRMIFKVFDGFYVVIEPLFVALLP